MSNIVVTFLTIVLILAIGYIIAKDLFLTPRIELANKTNNTNDNTSADKTKENFGALQSLYSNDGPQDAYLTIENDPSLFYDPYGYWRGVTWNVPTRNLNTISYYPYLYENHIDRYNTLYPYWSL
jgi:hypothetical protein